MSTQLLFLLILMESMAARSVRLILRSSLLELTELILMLVTGMPVFLMVFHSPLWLDTPTVLLSLKLAARSVRLILRSSLLELTELIHMLVTAIPVFLMVFHSPLWLDTRTVPLSHWNPQLL